MREEDMAILERGNQARVIRPTLTRIVDTLQNEILNSLLSQYNGGVLTDERARGMIGEIAGLEKINSRLMTEIRAADALDEELHNG